MAVVLLLLLVTPLLLLLLTSLLLNSAMDTGIGTMVEGWSKAGLWQDTVLILR